MKLWTDAVEVSTYEKKKAKILDLAYLGGAGAAVVISGAPAVWEMPGEPPSVVAPIWGNCWRKLASSSSSGFCALVLQRESVPGTTKE